MKASYFRPVTWILLVASMGAMPFSISAMMIAIEQGMYRSATVGIEGANIALFSCQARTAIWIAVLMFAVPLLVRTAHLKLRFQWELVDAGSRALIEHLAIAVAVVGLMLIVNLEVAKSLVQEIVNRACGPR